MSFLFWLSIALWLVSLLCYAVILSGNERLDRADRAESASTFFDVLNGGPGYARSLKYLYRTLVLSAIGALATGALYLLFGP